MPFEHTPRRRALKLLAAAGAAAALGWAAPACAADGSLDRIRAAGVIKIGVEGTFPPFSYRQGGELIGYDVDLAAIVFKKLGVKVQFVDTQWSGVVLALLSGRFDIIMSSLSYTKERMEKVAYSIPYADSSLALLVRSGDAAKIKSLDDLSGLTLGLKAGTPEEVESSNFNKKVAAARGAGFKSVKTFDADPPAYLALSQGSVDGVISNMTNLGMVLKQAPGKYALVQNIAGNSYAGIGIRKEDNDLRAYIDAEIKAAAASGQMAALQEKWFGLKFQLPAAVPSL
ncbi:transporter substrate-binding domain-containing protein [Piscinibacter sp.]|uniref:transporter substrate-binding domain-containing protein n=1 Tax=Piscinibacter sp. TaxID=1903157 RepID=UPI0039E3D509